MTKQNGQPLVILMADDDADDRMLTKDALTESRVINDLRFVEDGEEPVHPARSSCVIGSVIRTPPPSAGSPCVSQSSTSRAATRPSVSAAATSASRRSDARSRLLSIASIASATSGWLARSSAYSQREAAARSDAL